jgi:hypothetical protein
MTRFIIISHGRCGTNIFCNSLNLSKRVKCFMEPFHLKPEQRCPIGDLRYDESGAGSDFLRDHLYSIPGFDAVGFKIFLFHARSPASAATAWDFLSSDREIKVIYLYRDNILHSFVSEQKARHTGVWHPKQDRGQPKSWIHIDPGKAIKYLSKIEDYKKWGHEKFKDHESLHLTYENLAEDLPGCLGRAFDFIGVQPVAVDGVVFKSVTGPIDSTLIENYDEVRAALAGTRWEAMLD